MRTSVLKHARQFRFANVALALPLLVACGTEPVPSTNQPVESTAAGNDPPGVPAHCGSSSVQECATELSLAGRSQAARAEVQRLRKRFRVDDNPAIASGNIQRLEPSSLTPGALRAVVPEPTLQRGPWKLTATPVTVDLPIGGAGYTRVADPRSGVSVAVRLADAQNVAPSLADGAVLYPHAFRNGHIVQRATFVGVEDYVVLEKKPAKEELVYRLDVSHVSGIRVVESRIVEFLDEKGSPRLRVREPYVVTEDGTKVAAHVAIEGCDYDASPAAPWDRSVTPPNATNCLLVVSWSGASYPALVDPFFEAANNMPTTFGAFHRASLMASFGGRVLVVNGGSSGRSAAIFNPADDTWASTASTTGFYQQGGAARHNPGGWVVVAGGNFITSSSESYNQWNGVWHDAGSLGTVPAIGTTVNTDPTSSFGLFLVGGLGDPDTLGRDPSGTWLVRESPVTRYYHTTTGFDNGDFLIVGGAWDNGNTILDTALYFDHTQSSGSGGFKALVNNPSVPRVFHTATELDNGLVLIAGGSTSVASVDFPYAESDLFFPGQGRFNPGPDLIVSRGGHVAVPLSGGRVLFAGGAVAPAEVSAEIYDEATNAFTRIEDMPGTKRYYASGTALPDGRVLIAGGSTFTSFGNNGALNTSLIFQLSSSGACTTGLGCESGYCVNGFCCDGPCTSTCYSCSGALTGGADGSCLPVLDTIADPACTPSPPCGLTGLCDGSGACAYTPTDTPCGTAACSAGTAVDPRCNAAHACDNNTDPCGEFACGPVACRTSCTTDTHCANGYYCNTGSSSCEPTVGTGSPCTMTSECSGGTFCVDGVCCNTQCSGECMSCDASKTGGAPGECRPIAEGTDPDNECAQQAPGTCGLTGECSGAVGCAEYDTSTPCGPEAVCTSAQLTLHRCNGTGSCSAGNPQTCAGGFACEGPSCATSCSDNGDCADGYYCEAPSCLPKLTQGADCSSDAQCDSGFCVDGKCCNEACSAICKACSNAAKGQGSDGICGLVASGLDPHDTCPTENPSDCGFSGTCNGVGGCSYYNNVPCLGGATCQGNDAVGQLCNGQGSCVTQPNPVSCAPYLCINNQGCAFSCASDNDCSSNAYYCDQGSCQPRKADGAICQSANQCQSGNCVDGVCCENACTSKCQACSNAKKGAGEDGQCGPILAGRDPEEECDADPASTCGFSGACDGSGGCALHGSGTACGATQCNGNTVVGQVCDGSGSCIFDPSGVACSPFACNTLFGSCNTTCTSSSDCATGDFYCNSGQCEPKQIAGSACSEDAACVSEQCTDGVCCDSECTGQCEACDVAGSEGSCAPIPAGDTPHGSREACAGADTECAGACDGSVSACVYPGSETLCSESSCNGNVLEAVRCDGQGACVADQARDCGTYACDDEAVDCKSSCETNADCASGAECNTATGQCAAADTSCADAFTVEESDGSQTSCRPYRCSAGACSESCSDDSDCADGYSCLNSSCIEQGTGGTSGGGTGGNSANGTASSSKNEGGCGCRTAGDSSSTPWVALGIPILLAWRSRQRRGRRRQTACL